MRTVFLSFGCTLFLLFLGALPFAGTANADIRTSAEQAYVMDYDTGMVLFEKNSKRQMPTSSMSKVMTMIYVFEALQEGRISLKDELPVSEKAWRKGGSKMFVEVGKTVAVEDLIRGVIIQSGNDATIVLAEGLAGTEENFAAEITRMAHDIGMTQSNFMNASGWPDPDHYSTAEDLALMARHLIRTYPEYYDYYSETEYTYNNIKQKNRNPLLYREIGADGIKTGHTEAGGYGLIGSAAKGDRRAILVLNGLDSAKDRASESARIMQWALNNFTNKVYFRKDAPIVSADVVLGQQQNVSLAVERDVKMTVPVATSESVSAEAVFDAPLIAPVAQGDRIGTLRVIVPGYDTEEYALVAVEPVPELGFFARTLAKAKLFLMNQF